MQASVPRDCLDELNQAVMEMHNEVDTQYIEKDGYVVVTYMSHAEDNKAQVVRRALNPEMQNEENANTTTLCVHEDFDVNAEQIQEECDPKEGH